MKKIFISHSSKDIEYVESFVKNILILGLDIPADRIFCSSMEGQGIKSGQYIPDRLREEINQTSLALLFISNHYKSSEICLNEVGAAWATLSKENIIPLLLPSANFNQLGLLDLNRLGLKITEKAGILKLIQDCKDVLNPNFNLERLNKNIEEYLKFIDLILKKNTENKNPETLDENTDCFANSLYPYHEIFREAIPTYNNGIHRIIDSKTQTHILTKLSQIKHLENFWYRYSEGDGNIDKMKKLKSGNWVISTFNWEIKVSDMWVCIDSGLGKEFILIKSEKLEPYKIDSDIGGVSYSVGILNNGLIVSEMEKLNGYAKIGGESIKLDNLEVEPYNRDIDAHWIFLVSEYHKIGYNDHETIDFCESLDSGETEVNPENILKFLRSLKNHPTVTKYR